MLHDDKGINNSYLQAKVIILAGYFPGSAPVILQHGTAGSFQAGYLNEFK